MATENLTLSEFFGTQRNPFNYVKIEQINRDIVTGWLTLDEISQQLNLVDDQSQDSYLEGLELATRMVIEDYLGMTIFSTQWRVYYGNVGNFGTAVYLDLPEVSTGYKGAVANTINSVAYYNNANALTVLDPQYYVYDNTGNRLIITSIPDTLSQYVANPIVVTYTTNASFAAQYPVIKQAGLLMLTHLYNNRSNTTDGKLSELPWGVERLLRPYKPLVM